MIRVHSTNQYRADPEQSAERRQNSQLSMPGKEHARGSADEGLCDIVAGEHGNNGSGGGSKKLEAIRGRVNGVAVTAEDLALREDICYQIFGDVGPLIRDFSCAWDHKVVMHGRMYVTERRLCFYANFFGLEAKMSLRHEDVAKCSKGNSAIFIPNVIVVQDKSGKDFVFRAFWEREECHSLLNKLRVEAGELRVRADAEEDEEDEEEEEEEGGGRRGGVVEGLSVTVPPEAAVGVSWDGEADTTAGCRDNDSRSGGSEHTPEDPAAAMMPLSPTRGKGSGVLLRDGSTSPSEESSSGGLHGGRSVRPLSPQLVVGGTRSSSSLPPHKQRRGTRGSASSLPSSPNTAATTTVASSAGARERSYSMKATPFSSSPTSSDGGGGDGGGGGGGSGSGSRSGNGLGERAASAGPVGVVAAPPRPAKLGLAVLGADHDVPLSNGDCGSSTHGGRQHLVQQRQQRRQQQQQEHQQQRPSPRRAAVITGAGRGGWGSPAPSVGGEMTPPRSGRQHHGNASDADTDADAVVAKMKTSAAFASTNETMPAEVSMPVTRTRDRRGSGGGNGGGSSGGGGEAGDREGEALEDRADGATKQQREQEGSGRKAGLVRRGSQLWSMMMGGWSGAGAEEDPTVDIKEMQEAIAAGGENHTEVATAEFDVSVKEFYERFIADNAPYGLPDFHMSRGDWEVEAGEWEEWQQSTEGGEEATGAAKEGSEQGVKGRRGHGGVTRAIRFKTPLHITFMSSPGQVRTLKRQRSRFFGGQGCIVETQTTVEDRIPLSDNFHVEDRWIIRPAAAGEDGQQCCTATVTWRCVWHKFTVIKGLIEGKCRADVKSFNIAFLEGMREHLVESRGPLSSGVLKRRASLRESLLSSSGGVGGRRVSRERSFSGRSLLSSLAGSEEYGGGVTGTGALSVEDLSKSARLFDRFLPGIRVFSILFVLYISLFWVRHQIWDGRGAGGGGGWEGGKDELMRLYGEWGRSSLALLDVTEETRRLSADLSQLDLDLAGSARGRAGPSSKEKDSRRRYREATEVEQLLREVEDKVSRMSRRVDSALTTLDATASQIREEMACPCARGGWGVFAAADAAATAA
ncbi:unnamed protein product [Pylaiella littoralis]